MPVLKCRFDNAELEFDGDKLIATFWDGVVNEIVLSECDTPDVHAAAEEMGYGDDWRTYLLDHELTHHWLSDKMCWRWSYSLHDNPRLENGERWQAHVAWEEHLVNAIQKEVHNVEPDEIDIVGKIWPGKEARYELIKEWRKNVFNARRELLGH